MQPASKRPEWTNQRIDQRIIEDFVDDETEVFSELAAHGVSEAAVRAHARTIGLTDTFIKECRLSDSRPALRPCVRCDERFLSSGIHNRMCRRCSPR